MTQRTIAIGDIHGCSTAFQTLIDAIQPQPEDALVTLGDYVDRGPNSSGVLDLLIALIDCCELIPLLGNHDLMLLQAMSDPAVFDFWMTCGGNTTLDSYGRSLDNIPVEHWLFLRNLRPFYETDRWIFVHANYDAQLPLSQTSEDLMLWQHVTTNPPGPHVSGKKVIVGHTPQASGHILDLGHLVCIDTYCFGGGWLSALELETGKIWQANEEGQLRHA